MPSFPTTCLDGCLLTWKRGEANELKHQVNLGQVCRFLVLYSDIPILLPTTQLKAQCLKAFCRSCPWQLSQARRWADFKERNTNSTSWLAMSVDRWRRARKIISQSIQIFHTRDTSRQSIGETVCSGTLRSLGHNAQNTGKTRSSIAEQSPIHLAWPSALCFREQILIFQTLFWK